MFSKDGGAITEIYAKCQKKLIIKPGKNKNIKKILDKLNKLSYFLNIISECG